MLSVGVVGSGAVASLYAMMLQRSGATVSMVCRSGVDQIRQEGIFVRSIWGDERLVPKMVCRDSSELPDDLDLIIIATKVYPDLDLQQLLGPYVDGRCPILFIQNGIFIEEPYLKRWPHLNVYSGLAFVCVSRLSYTEVEHIDYGRLDLGVYPKGESPILKQMAEALQSVGMDCRVSSEIQKQRWEKLIWNAPFNPLSVITGQNTADMLADESTTQRIRAIMTEVYQCAEDNGFRLDPGIIDLKITQTAKMTPYKTSMLLDYEAGRRLEYDAILGNLLAYADQQQIQIPVCRTLYNDLITYVQDHRKECL